MDIILQQNLPHQQRAVDAVCDALAGVQITLPSQFYENPRICLNDPRLSENIRFLQSEIPSENRGFTSNCDCLNLDVKMETGTGKTYVYTKIIYELHKRYGLNKFIIAVPSLAIKEGTAMFLQEPYARRHFTDACGYGTEMEVCVLEAQQKKKGRSYFPSVVSDFVKGSCQDTQKIYVLLVNMQLLAVRANGMLSRDDYDYGVEGFYRPFDAIGETRPVVIIDEPHRFSRDQKAFQVIMEEIRPQAILRFGATFPEISVGTGKKKSTRKDYQNLLYDLNACASFNQNLIKCVAKEHFEPISRKAEKIKILSIAGKDSVTFQYKKQGESTRTQVLKAGDSLSTIHEAFMGITISGITKNTVIFSNGMEKSSGEEMDVDIYMTSYQEQMVRLALQRHFETERVNFSQRTFKIKTLALFFIDDISSYRTNPGEKSPYLLLMFERLLKEQLETTIAQLDESEQEYKDFLKASLANVSACHAGYFSQDNKDTDEEIAREIHLILRGKKHLLSFRNADRSYNTLRFLFSKWTLKEGWDNPNVFTIAKLRSSGSEISKLQEVGRGLRLPVDENGNRISNEEFQLNYIVDFTEADFASKLVEQINGDIPQALSIHENMLLLAAKKRGISSDELFEKLLSKKYIDRHSQINPENRDAFLAEYPEFSAGLTSGKVKDLNQNKPKTIRIRPKVYAEIKKLWETINQRYFLFYEPELNQNLEEVVLEILEKPGVFRKFVVSSRREVVESDGSTMRTSEQNGTQYVINRPIAYNEFLKRISQMTNLPVKILHQGMCAYAKKHGTVSEEVINESSVAAFCSEFQTWRTENLQGRFRYAKSNIPCGATALTNASGEPYATIAQGRIGTKMEPGVPCDKYLYDTFAYDSPLEKTNIQANIDEIVVYGKIPRNSIAIPTITGGSYSPDFMYVIKRASGQKELYLVVETKDVENKDELRELEKVKIDCARVFFETLSKEGYPIHFREQLKNSQMAQIIHEVLE